MSTHKHASTLIAIWMFVWILYL